MGGDSGVTAFATEEATGKGCGVPMAKLPGKSWAPHLPSGTVNVGTTQVSPSAPFGQLGGGQARRQLMPSGVAEPP